MATTRPGSDAGQDSNAAGTPLDAEGFPAAGAVSAAAESAPESQRVLLPASEPAVALRAVVPFGWSEKRVRQTIGILLGLYVGYWFLSQIQAILPPFLIAFFLAALLDPTLRTQERHGRSRVYSIVMIYLVGLLLVVLFVIKVIPAAVFQVEELSRNASTYSSGIQQSADEFMRKNTRLLNMAGVKEHKVRDLVEKQSSRIQKTVTEALGGVTLFLSGAASKVLWLIIIPVAAFFFMRDYPVLRARMIFLFPEPYHEHIDRMSREIVDVFSTYLRGLTKVCLIYGLTLFVVFWMLGVRYALFLGMVAGVFYAVPYVGQLITGLGSGLVAYLMERHTVFFFFEVGPQSLSYTLLVIGAAVVLQNLFDQIVYPRVVGASVGLHPVISIFALMAGATLFGLWGMLVAVPVAASIQIILMFVFPKLLLPPPARLVDPQLPA